MTRFLIALIVLVPSLASAQVSPYPLGVSAPIFGLPASAVSGGGSFTGQLLGPSTTCYAYSFTASPTTGLGSDTLNQWCLSANGTAILRGTTTTVTSAVPILHDSATGSITSGADGNQASVLKISDRFTITGANTVDFLARVNNTGAFSFSTVVAGSPGVRVAIGNSGAFTSVAGLTAAGATGVPVVVAVGRVTAQSAANASISTFTVGAADASFEVSGNMNVTGSTALTTTLTVTYTDESNTARSMILPVASLAGSFIAAGSITGAGASVWETPVMHIRAKAATVITILTSAGTFTGVTYTAEGVIKQTK